MGMVTGAFFPPQLWSRLAQPLFVALIVITIEKADGPAIIIGSGIAVSSL